MKHLRKRLQACRKRMHESHDAWTLSIGRYVATALNSPHGTWNLEVFACLMLVIRVTALASTIMALASVLFLPKGSQRI